VKCAAQYTEPARLTPSRHNTPSPPADAEPAQYTEPARLTPSRSRPG
jgi:hypothetical protein